MTATSPAARTPSPLAAVSDEDLVAAATVGDDRALAELLGRFRPQVAAKARTYFVRGGDRHDVIQEGMIGLYKAVRDYDRARHPSFRAFADICITRQILTAIKGATRHKHGPLNTAVSYDAAPDGPDDGTAQLVRAAVADDRDDPVRHVTQAAELEQLRAFCNEVLSDLEADVLTRYAAGESYQDIADDLGRHVKAVDNAVQRIKRKLEAYLAQRAAAPA